MKGKRFRCWTRRIAAGDLFLQNHWPLAWHTGLARIVFVWAVFDRGEVLEPLITWSRVRPPEGVRRAAVRAVREMKDNRRFMRL